MGNEEQNLRAARGDMAGALPWYVALSVACFSIVFGLVALIQPHGRDQGSYAYAGWRLLFGEVPYRDVFSFKPPGTVLVHSLAALLFGTDPMAIRAVDIGWIAATAVVVMGLTQSLTRRRFTAVLAGVAVPVLYFQVDYWNTAQTDGWMVLPAMGSLWLALVARRPWQWIFAGVLAAIAILFKYTAAVFALPLLVLFVLAWKEREQVGLGYFIVGLLSPLILTVVVLVVTGAWADFVDIQFNLVPSYVSTRRKNRTLLRTASKLLTLTRHRADIIPLFVAATLTLPAMFVLRATRLRALFLLLLWIGAIVGIVAQGKFYDYHYLPLLGPGSMAVGVVVAGALTWVNRRLPSSVIRPFFFVTAAVFFLVIGVSFWGQLVTESIPVWTGEKTRIAYWKEQSRFRYRDYNVNQVRRAAEWISANSKPDDPVFVWSYEPAILVGARRRQVSRFLYNFPFRVNWKTKDYRPELMAALHDSPPVLFVVGSKDVTRGVTGSSLDSRASLNKWPQLRDYLRDRYCLEEKIGRYSMYRACTRP